MEKFLETQNLPKWNYKEIEHLNRSVTSKESESVIKNLPAKKSPGPEGSNGEFYRTFKELVTILLKLFQTLEEGVLPNSFLWDQHYPDATPWQRHKKRKLD